MFITVSAVDDYIARGSVRDSLSYVEHLAESSNTYDNASFARAGSYLSTTEVWIIEDDIAGFVTNVSHATVLESEPTWVAVRLQSEPTSDVHVFP